jgi:hypothetical protein
MKKIIIAAAIISITGLAALYTQVGNTKPSLSEIKITFYDHQKELSSAD